MEYILTGKQMREADLYTINKIGMPSMVLMERAALRVTEAMEQEGIILNRALIVCGSGNNGGDGYAIARLLHLKGKQVEICFIGREEARSEENRLQKQIAEYYKIPMYQYDTDMADSVFAKEYDVVVDAVFGTGLKRNIEGVYARLIAWMNQKPAVKVAVDIPSGIHDTTGKVMGTAFYADLTVAIAFRKRGVVMYPGAEYAGKTVVGEIGIPESSVPKEGLTKAFELQDLYHMFPKRKADSHKGSYGKVLMIAGAKGMSGAAYLCANAAYAVGAGLVQIYTAEENRTILQQLLPEAIVTAYEKYDEEQLTALLHWADVVLIGCGLGKNEISVKIVQETIKTVVCPCIVDADALNILSENMMWLKEQRRQRIAANQMIFTPHMKEMSRLLKCSVSELAENREEYLLEFAEKYEVVCALKDTRTWVIQNKEKQYINLSGNEAMAKAGSGDVLAGIIAGIQAQMGDSYQAACLGVYLHGLAGDAMKKEKGSYSVLARELVEGVARVLKNI